MHQLPMRRVGLALALACAIAFSAGFGADSLAGQDSPSIIRACVHKSSMQMRLLPAGATCRPNEELVAWNKVATGAVKGRLISCATTGSVAGVAFELVSLAGHSFTAKTDQNGDFQFHFVPPGTYDIAPPYAAAGPVLVLEGQTTDLPDLQTMDLSANPTNCGACGVTCGATETCVNGACVPSNGCPIATPIRCWDGTCVANGAACPVQPPACPVNQTMCSGVCVDTRANLNHCGACGSACPPRPNAISNCSGGVCAFTCMTGFSDCDGLAANGCETNLLSDARHCGRCGSACQSGTCANGACTVPLR